MLKYINQINKALKIGDEFTIYYAPTFTKDGQDQTSVYEAHQYEVNSRLARWTKVAK